MSRFSRIVFFLLAVVAFVLLAQWTYTDPEAPREVWEDTKGKVTGKVNEWWPHGDSQVEPEEVEDLTAGGQIRKKLKDAEIIGDVIDDFTPKLLLEVSWDSGNEAELGNLLKPADLEDQPVLKLTELPSSHDNTKAMNKFLASDSEQAASDDGNSGSGSDWSVINDRSTLVKRVMFSEKEYAVVMTDPDAPSRDDPKWSEFCHWIGTNLHVQTEEVVWSDEVEDLMEYYAPAPPEGSGEHRYVFIVFMSSSDSDDELDLTKPDDRKKWGYDEQRHGVKQWADKNKLVPVAANFIYAKNDKDFGSEAEPDTESDSDSSSDS